MGETETQSQREPASGLLGWIRRTPPLVLPMVVLSAGLVVAGAVAVKGVRTAADTITVTGASTERIRSDFADWTVVVLGSGTSQQAAYQDLQPDLQRTLAFLRTQGVPDGSVQLAVLESSSNDIRNRGDGGLVRTEWPARPPRSLEWSRMPGKLQQGARGRPRPHSTMRAMEDGEGWWPVLVLTLAPGLAWMTPWSEQRVVLVICFYQLLGSDHSAWWLEIPIWD